MAFLSFSRLLCHVFLGSEPCCHPRFKRTSCCDWASPMSCLVGFETVIRFEAKLVCNLWLDQGLGTCFPKTIVDIKTTLQLTSAVTICLGFRRPSPTVLVVFMNCRGIKGTLGVLLGPFSSLFAGYMKSNVRAERDEALHCQLARASRIYPHGGT